MLFSKKEISEFPFAELHHTLDAVAKEVKQQIISEAEQIHYTRAEAQINKLYASMEESFEGSLEERCPFPGVDPSIIRAEQIRVKKDAFKVFADKHDLQTNASWLLPQLMAYIATIPLSYTPEGLVNSHEYLMSFAKDDFHKGIWAFCAHPIRGDMITKQYTPEVRNYSALVPLILMPHKRYNNIPYSKWDKAYLDKLIDPNLYQAMTTDFINTYSANELVDIRTEALMYKSGKSIGAIRSAQTSHKVYSLSGELKKLPWLVQVMLFQIWVAHPANRTDLMILDWNNWDNIPEPLILTDIVPQVVKSKSLYKKTDTSNDDLPWD